eukprot:scaffold4462_cov119-Skeletonema_dohrnii-CCMP3373.AAC.5
MSRAGAILLLILSHFFCHEGERRRRRQEQECDGAQPVMNTNELSRYVGKKASEGKAASKQDSLSRR